LGKIKMNICNVRKSILKMSPKYVDLPSYIFRRKLLQYKSRKKWGVFRMTVNDAVAKRVSDLLKANNMSQYRLEQETGIQHGSMQCIMNGRNKTVTLSTVILLAKGFHMSLPEFLNDEVFSPENLDLE